MKGLTIGLSVALGATTALSSALAPRASSSSKTPKVTIKGNAFFAGSDRFFIRGVDYQPGGSSKAADPLADVDICKRDIDEFKKLNINTVRIYTIDNTKDHDECMGLLADAGIYLALDVNTPKYSIRQDKPGPSYNGKYLQNVFATVDKFQKYDNLLLFFAGNEVINDVPTSESAPYVKAVIRDMKQYISNRGYRKIPVGYSAADISKNRIETAHYLNCGTDDARGDFFAFNDYSWCAPSDFKESGWSQKIKDFGDYSVPIFLSEYGCVETPRNFEEVATLYSDKMSSVYSGGLAYEYTQEAGNPKYGLVKVSGDTATNQPDFKDLSDAFEKVQDFKGDHGYKTSGTKSECPPKSDTFLVDGNGGLPIFPPSAKKYMTQGAGTGQGLLEDAPGSQEVGAETSGTASAGSGEPTKTGSASGSGTASGAAGALRAPEMSFAPVWCCLVALAGTFLGATLL